MFPVADFEIASIIMSPCNNSCRVEITNKSEGADFYWWNYGNGSKSFYPQEETTPHTYLAPPYDKPGKYTVLLQAYHTASGAWSEKELTFEISPRQPQGLGILSLANGSNLSPEGAHPNQAFIDGWKYDAAANRIRAVGDVDGDGIDEFIVTSNWGIGILKYHDARFKAILTAPRDTWFGGWRYDATVNPGRDKILDVQNFTGTPKSEIMIWSSWGITTLEYNGASLVPSRIHANGTRFGGWLLNTGDNIYCGSGKFDSDSTKDMVLLSPWGLGIISLQNSTHIYMNPNGTRFGGWLLNSRDNTIRLIADLDGDGLDEILISSPWGIGVLKLVGGILTSVAMYPNGSNLGGYVVRNSDNFALADQLKGTANKQILVTNELGIHILSLAGNQMTRLAFAGNGTRIGGWLVNTNDNQFQSIGDMLGDKRADFLIQSPWGIGIMGIDAANVFQCYCMYPYTTPLFTSIGKDWCLQSNNRIVGVGNLLGGMDKKELLITPTPWNNVKYGSVVKIKHMLTGCALHSHAQNYSHPATSGQQQVTAYAGSDDNDLWLIKRPHGYGTDFPAGQPVKDWDVIRLEHVLTRRNLHSHAGVPSPVTGQQEVTAYGTNGIGDGNDNWRIELEGGGIWEKGQVIRLIHVETNHALHSHVASHPQWTAGQQEVTGYGGRDGNDWWIISEVR